MLSIISLNFSIVAESDSLLLPVETPEMGPDDGEVIPVESSSFDCGKPHKLYTLNLRTPMSQFLYVSENA